MRIEEALKVEQNYLNSNSEESLISKLSSLGYQSLEEYFQEKRFYSLLKANLSIETMDESTIIETLHQRILNKTPALLFSINKKECIYYGGEPYNKDYCMNNDVQVYSVGHHGGNIVAGKDDMGICLVLPEEIEFSRDDFLQMFQETIFNMTGITTIIDNNDLMWNNKKVAGSAAILANNMRTFVINLSFTDTLSDINTICYAEREKEPSFLPLVDRYQIAKEVQTWLLRKLD